MSDLKQRQVEAAWRDTVDSFIKAIRDDFKHIIKDNDYLISRNTTIENRLDDLEQKFSGSTLEGRQVEALERIAVTLEKLLRLTQLFAASYDVQYGNGVLKKSANELLKTEDEK